MRDTRPGYSPVCQVCGRHAMPSDRVEEMLARLLHRVSNGQDPVSEMVTSAATDLIAAAEERARKPDPKKRERIGNLIAGASESGLERLAYKLADQLYGPAECERRAGEGESDNG